MKVIIYRDKETKQIVKDAGNDYELLKARGKTDEDIVALVEEFNGRENCPQTVEIVELDDIAEFYAKRAEPYLGAPDYISKRLRDIASDIDDIATEIEAVARK